MSAAKEETQRPQFGPLEQKVADVDFQNVWNQLAFLRFPDFRSSHEFAYMAGRVAGKNDAIQQLIKAAEEIKGASQ